MRWRWVRVLTFKGHPLPSQAPPKRTEASGLRMSGRSQTWKGLVAIQEPRSVTQFPLLSCTPRSRAYLAGSPNLLLLGLNSVPKGPGK